MNKVAGGAARRKPVVRDPDYVDAKTATETLSIKPQTLYAYVSRGWIRRVPATGGRGHLYLREDVDRLGARTRSRAESGLLKRAAPHWSEPVVQTSITRLTPDGPEYRGHPVLTLARRGARFENVAEMLWSGVLSESAITWHDASLPPAFDRIVADPALRPADAVDCAGLLALTLAVRDDGDDIRHASTVACARRLLSAMAACLGLLAASPRIATTGAPAPLAARIARAFAVDESDPVIDALNCALVLLADHQLTPQTVAARLAASSGATLYHCLNAALSVHSHSRSRRDCDSIETLFAASREPADFVRRVEAARRETGRIPGFDHPLYPDGDPRAPLLIEGAEAVLRSRRRQARLPAFLAAAEAAFGVKPSIEAALVVLCRAIGLPGRAAGALLTLSRCAGWTGHVIEQRMAGLMLRPRNRYRG